MMRRAAMVLVCLLVGLGIYGGSYGLVFKIDGGQWLLDDSADPFSDPPALLIARWIFAPASWVDNEIVKEIPYRKKMRGFLRGRWVTGSGGVLTVDADGRCRFEFGDLVGEGWVNTRWKWSSSMVEFETDRETKFLVITEPISADPLFLIPVDKLGGSDVVCWVTESASPQEWAVRPDTLIRGLERDGGPDP